MWQKAIEMLTKIIWPWIKVNVWPIIQAKLIDVVVELVGWAFQQIKDLLTSNNHNRYTEAKKKEEAAQKRAESTVDPVAASEANAEARIWREVAEQYRRDNEDLKEKLAKLESESIRDATREISEITPELHELSSVEGPKLRIASEVYSLPRIGKQN